MDYSDTVLDCVFTTCTNCEEEIDGDGFYSPASNTMFIDCPSCNEEMIVYGWYDDED